MRLKNTFYILLANLLAVGFTACIREATTVETVVSKDAQLIAFQLSHDSVPALTKASFTINQETGEIYNHDSLPFQTRLFPKAIVTFTTGSRGSQPLMFEKGVIDTTMVASGDSLQLPAANTPLVFKVYSTNNVVTKTYQLTICVHTVDVDSIQYSRLPNTLPFAGEAQACLWKDNYYAFANVGNAVALYQSDDLTAWNPQTLSSLPNTVLAKDIRTADNILFATDTASSKIYATTDALTWHELTGVADPVITVLGYLKPQPYQTGGLALVVNKAGKPTFAVCQPDTTTWTADEWTTKDTVPANFPLSDFSVIHNQSPVMNRITVVENLHSVWTTEDGLLWVKIDNTIASIPTVSGGTVFPWKDEIWFMNGQLSSGDYNAQIYYSVDGGMVWKPKPAKSLPPATYLLRSHAAWAPAKDGRHFYILGGRRGNTFLTDTWELTRNSDTFTADDGIYTE